MSGFDIVNRLCRAFCTFARAMVFEAAQSKRRLESRALERPRTSVRSLKDLSWQLRGLPRGRTVVFKAQKIMADVLLNSNEQPNSIPNHRSTPSGKRRLNWLTWMRKSLNLGAPGVKGGTGNKLCACGFSHSGRPNHARGHSVDHGENEHRNTEAGEVLETSDWPVFTTRMSQGKCFKTNFQ